MVQERAIVNAILKYLNSLPECFVAKVHGSQFMVGWPDLLGCFRGRALALEVKRPGGKPTALQLAMLEKWRGAGAIAAVVYSVSDVKELLKGDI